MLPGISISGQVPHLRGTLHHDAAILLTGRGRLKNATVSSGASGYRLFTGQSIPTSLGRRAMSGSESLGVFNVPFQQLPLIGTVE